MAARSRCPLRAGRCGAARPVLSGCRCKRAGPRLSTRGILALGLEGTLRVPRRHGVRSRRNRGDRRIRIDAGHTHVGDRQPGPPIPGLGRGAHRRLRRPSRISQHQRPFRRRAPRQLRAGSGAGRTRRAGAAAGQGSAARERHLRSGADDPELPAAGNPLDGGRGAPMVALSGRMAIGGARSYRRWRGRNRALSRSGRGVGETALDVGRPRRSRRRRR